MLHLVFFDWRAEHFKETLIVPGNHEFYGGYDIARTLGGFELPVRDNVFYLNNRSRRYGDTELFLTTMWSHYGPIDQLNAQLLLNDYEYGVPDGERFEAFAVNRVHRRCSGWLGEALDGSDARRKVVVSHHCPVESPDKLRYIGERAAPCYMTDMSDFLTEHRPDIWIHGHVHFVRSHGEVLSGTSIYSNPLGYTFDGEEKPFCNSAVISF